MRASLGRDLGVVLHLLPIAVGLLALPSLVDAATIRGSTTTQNRSMRLPGVEVIVSHVVGDRRVGAAVSDVRGVFEVRDLEAGRYQVVARLAGFTDLAPAPITLAEGETIEIDLDLALAPLTEEVKVVGQASLAHTDTSVSRDTVKGQMYEFLPVVGDGYRALLPVLPGVVRAPDGRISLKGARESQGALQVGRGYANDPSTGNFAVELPADSIESVDVLPNPYSAEDGRFTSTVVQIETRAGSNRWSSLVNGFVPIPCLKVCDGENVGIRNFRPRGWFGGPLVKDRLFIAQGAQYRFATLRVPGLPDAANDTTDHGVESFTRLDAKLSSAHALVATAAFFTRRTRFVGLSPFIPAEVAPSLRFTGYSVAVSESATLSPTVVAESSFTASVYHADIFGEGTEPHELTVDGQRGNFFNTQDRRTRSLQLTGSVTSLRRGFMGEHVLRAGVNFMWSAYSGSSRSNPVVVRRADGTASQRFDFDGLTMQQASGADAAAFVQDRWRVSERLRFEPGLRVDRNGVIGRTNLSPRIGFVAGLLGGDTGVLRGGIGVFYERTPLNVAAFGSFETATLTRFASDGLTPVSPPATFTQIRGPFRAPRSVIWNIEYDQRLGPRLFVKVNHLQRQGTDIGVIEPRELGNAAELRLESRGRSRYAETELTVRFGTTDFRNLAVSYVRSHAVTHLNVFDAYFGSVRNPIVRPDQYALSPTDVPNRLLIRGTITGRGWTISSVVEMRNGFPYSVVDQDQNFVGIRNAGGRFPNLYTLDLSIIRSATLLGRRVRFGFRGSHLLNEFNPRDVQNNIDSPAFKTFHNTLPRRLGLTFTFVPR